MSDATAPVLSAERNGELVDMCEAAAAFGFGEINEAAAASVAKNIKRPYAKCPAWDELRALLAAAEREAEAVALLRACVEALEEDGARVDLQAEAGRFLAAREHL